MLSSVVLPDPLGPMMPTISPGIDAEGDVGHRDEAGEALAEAAHLKRHASPSRRSGCPRCPAASREW